MHAIRAFFQHRPWAMLLLLVAVLALRAVVPAGTMPATDGDGRIMLLLCNAEGGRTIAFDPGPFDSGTAGDRGDAVADAGHSPCAFAGGLNWLTEPPLALPALILFPLLLLTGWRARHPAAIVIDWRQPPSQAPPTLA